MSMQVGGESPDSAAICSAILLYEDRYKRKVFATIHPVEIGKRSRPAIGAGRPVTREGLVECFSSLTQSAAPRATFLPATVLAVDPCGITWWMPPAMRRVFFDCEELGTVSAIVPHPGLVFQAASTGFRVFSLLGADRPTEETALYEPPYFNTWDDGKICIGTAKVPTTISPRDIPGWEAGFFNSAFTHPNHGKTRVAYQNGVYAFWRDMLAGHFNEAFPRETLVPTIYNLSALIGGLKS